MADEIHIRFLSSADDIEALVVARKFRERQGGVDRRRLKAFLNDETTFALCAFDGEEPVGLILAHRLRRFDGDPDELYVHAVDVLESHRRRGIASRMLEFFKSRLQELDCGEMWLITERANEPALTLYRKAGGRTENADSLVFKWEAG